MAAVARRLPQVMEALRGLPGPAAVVLLAVGAAVLCFGARTRKPLAVVGGAVVGLGAGAALAGWLGGEMPVPAPLLCGLLALVLAVLSGLWPPLFLFGAGALPGALLGFALPAAGQAHLGLVAGLVAGGMLALSLARWVAAVSSAGLGAAILAAGLFGAAGDSVPLRVMQDHPLVLAALVAVLTVSGAAFQHSRAWPPPARRPAGGAIPDEMPTVAGPQ